jgi:RNA polymerase sigma-70 factor, ECF subfamily
MKAARPALRTRAGRRYNGDGRAARPGRAAVTTPDRKSEFARYLTEHQARLYGYIHSLVPDLNHADDLYQQTALVLWGKFDDFDRSRSFFAWACGVARFEAANFVRALARQRRFFGEELSLLLIAAHEEMADDELDDRRTALGRCVDKLNPADRELLTECYLGLGGVPAAAARRNRSVHGVYNSLRRIRQALHECVTRALRS